MPTTAYAVTVTPPVDHGFYRRVGVRFELASSPGASPNPQRPAVTLDGALIGDSDATSIAAPTTFYFVAATAVNVILFDDESGETIFRQAGVVPAAYATPTAVTAQPASSGTASTDLTSQFVPLAQDINPQTGTTYGFVATDARKLVTASNLATQTYTVPADVFDLGDQVDLRVLGAGRVDLVPGVGVTFVPTGSLALTQGKFANFQCLGDNTFAVESTLDKETIGIAVSDEATAISAGTTIVTFRMPFAMHLTGVRASLSTASSSGIPTVDINEGGATILSTKLTIDANEKTSTTAATAAVISDPDLADDAEITVDIDVAGTGAKGLKIWLIGTRA